MFNSMVPSIVPSRFVRIVIGAAVRRLGPISRASASPANLLLNTSCSWFCDNQPQILLDFPFDWPAQEGELYAWYKNQPTRRFISLEYHKEKEGTFRHEFIVLRLDNGTICRFDRRAKHDARADAPKFDGTISEDTAHVLRPGEKGYLEVEKQSDILLSISFPEGEDLSVILSICCGIKKNGRSERYTLTRYNCYFFSWTIVSIIGRRAVKWEQVAESESEWHKVVESSLERVASDSEAPIRSTKASPPVSPPKGDSSKDENVLVEDKHSDSPTAEEAIFRGVLRDSLADIREAAGKRLPELLLRSELRPVLEELVDKQVKAAMQNYKARAAERSAISIAMSEVCKARENPGDSEQFGDLSWNHHCELACTVALDAASATSQVAKDGDDVASGIWAERWDETWEKQWNNAIPESGNTDETKKLAAQVCDRARQTWREEWDRTAKICTKHFSLIVSSTTECLLDHLPDLDSQRLRFGKRASVGSFLWIRSSLK